MRDGSETKTPVSGFIVDSRRVAFVVVPAALITPNGTTDRASGGSSGCTFHLTSLIELVMASNPVLNRVVDASVAGEAGEAGEVEKAG